MWYLSRRINYLITKGKFDSLFKMFFSISEERRSNFIDMIDKNKKTMFYTAYFQCLSKNKKFVIENFDDLKKVAINDEMLEFYIEMESESFKKYLLSLSENSIDDICDIICSNKQSVIKKIKSDTIIEFVKNGNFDFVGYLDFESINMLCDKYQTNSFVINLAKIDYDKFKKYFSTMYFSDYMLKNLLTSLLEIDYDKTMAFLKERNPAEQDGLLWGSDYSEMLKLLVDNKFLFDKNYYGFLPVSKVFFFAALSLDYKNAFTYSRFWENCDNDDILAIYKEKLTDVRLEDLPKKFVANEDVLKFYIKEDANRTLILEILKSNRYSKECEMKLLDNFVFKFNSVEEKIISMFSDEKNKTRDRMSIYELLVIDVYIKKKLYEKGIYNVIVDVFDFGEKYRYGDFIYEHSSGSYKVSVSNLNRKIMDIIKTGEHECAHADQRYNIVNLNVDSDEDLDVYSKDYFLRKYSDEKYYSNNYWVIPSEYNAEYKGYIESVRLFGLLDECYNQYKDIIGTASKDSKKKIDDCFGYNFDVYRTVEIFGEIVTMHINDLMEFKLDELIFSDRGVISFIEERVPLISYEYDLNKKSSPRRRNLESLVNCIISSKNEKEKKVFKQIFVNRFDVRKEKREDIEKSIALFKRLVDKKMIEEDIIERVKEKIDYFLLSQVSLSKKR